MKILIAHASAHGSTREVGEFIGRMLRAYDAEVTVANVKDVQDVTGYDAFIPGAEAEEMDDPRYAMRQRRMENVTPQGAARRRAG